MQCFSTFFGSRHPIWQKKIRGSLNRIKFTICGKLISKTSIKLLQIQYFAAPHDGTHVCRGTPVGNHCFNYKMVCLFSMGRGPVGPPLATALNIITFNGIYGNNFDIAILGYVQQSTKTFILFNSFMSTSKVFLAIVL
jgi:hypothetical protein